MTLDQVLTKEMDEQCRKIYLEASPGTFAKRACEEVIRPNIELINSKLGQENDPMYLAYAAEYTYNTIGLKKNS